MLALLGMLILKVFLIYHTQCLGSQTKTAVYWFMLRFRDPVRFVNYVAAISMTAAPLIYIKDISIRDPFEWFSLAGLFLGLILAFLGGSDSTRIFYSLLPLYLILILKVIQTKGPFFGIFCALGYFVTNWVGVKIAEPQN
ncbi:MAG: hypothetical protein RMJ39_09790 [Deltaproteobacteria bacterium]|nr:hypothetical protein [Deltaproteobacteria bacterium]